MTSWIERTASPGPLLALTAAALWAVSPMFMASAGRKVGSFPVVLLRSALASVLLAITIGLFAIIAGPPPMPTGAQVAWLSLSGLLGMGIGDVLIYEAFVTLGPRRTTQTLVLAPAIAVLTGWLTIGEAMPPMKLAGIAVILGATFYAIFARRRPPENLAAGESGDVRPAGEPGHVSLIGVLCAIGGAICMGLGAVTARRAFTQGPPMDRAVATLIRVASAGIVIWFAPIARGRVRDIVGLMRDPHVRNRIAVGTLLGPYIGMYAYVSALKASPAGLVSTLVATSPLFAIPVTMLRYRAKIGWDVWLAAVVAVGGVAILCMD